jgi:hypothetical protein
VPLHNTSANGDAEHKQQTSNEQQGGLHATSVGKHKHKHIGKHEQQTSNSGGKLQRQQTMPTTCSTKVLKGGKLTR